MANNQIKPTGDQILERLYREKNPTAQDTDIQFILQGLHINTREFASLGKFDTRTQRNCDTNDNMLVQMADVDQNGPLFEARLKYLDPAYLSLDTLHRNYAFQNASRRVEVVYIGRHDVNVKDDGPIHLPKGHTLPRPATDCLLFTAPLNHSAFCWIALQLGNNKISIRVCHVRKATEGSEGRWCTHLQRRGRLEWHSEDLGGGVGGFVGTQGRLWTPMDYRGNDKRGQSSIFGFWSAAYEQWTLYAQVVVPSGERGPRGPGASRPRRVTQVWRLYPNKACLYNAH